MIRPPMNQLTWIAPVKAFTRIDETASLSSGAPHPGLRRDRQCRPDQAQHTSTVMANGVLSPPAYSSP